MKRIRYLAPLVFVSVSLAGFARPASALPARPIRHAVTEPAMLAQQTTETSSHEHLFDWINFVLLVAVLIYVLRRPLGHFFVNRSRSIERGIEDGRKALEVAQAQLAEADEKLRRLGEEIAGLKAEAVREREAERERLRRASEEEGKRIVEAARNMIASATHAARLELRRRAAAESVELAEKMIRERIDPAVRARLLSRFIEGIRKD